MGSLKKELMIFVILLLAGLLILPFCIYIVGQNIIGEYSPDAGAFGLVTAIWNDFAAFSPAAWILVLSPWAVVTLLRFAVRIWRAPARTSDAAET